MKRSVIFSSLPRRGCEWRPHARAPLAGGGLAPSTKDIGEIEGETADPYPQPTLVRARLREEREGRAGPAGLVRQGGAAQLSRQGVDGKTPKAGDKVIVGGHPGAIQSTTA